MWRGRARLGRSEGFVRGSTGKSGILLHGCPEVRNMCSSTSQLGSLGLVQVQLCSCHVFFLSIQLGTQTDEASTIVLGGGDPMSR